MGRATREPPVSGRPSGPARRRFGSEADGSPRRVPSGVSRVDYAHAVINRNHILAEIKRTAAANGGAALGWRRFQAETGVRERDWLRYWPRWGDAVTEAGLAPNKMQDPFSEDALTAALADEARRLGRFPTIRELRIRHASDPSFPDAKVFSNRWTKRERVDRVDVYCRGRPEFASVLKITALLLEADGPAMAEPNTRERPVVFGAVYLLRVGRHYKVGRTNAFGRREYELAIQLPEPATTVHVIKTDDPVGIEAYWHRRFADRRGNGEWFALTAEDVAAFKRRKFM